MKIESTKRSLADFIFTFEFTKGLPVEISYGSDAKHTQNQLWSYLLRFWPLHIMREKAPRSFTLFDIFLIRYREMKCESQIGNWFFFHFFSVFSELCWRKATVAYTKPQQRKKEESERLRGEREIRSSLLILDLKDGKL